jgi:hypothetical protein
MGLARASTALLVIGGAAGVASIIMLVIGKRAEKQPAAKDKLSLGVSPAGIWLGCLF